MQQSSAINLNNELFYKAQSKLSSYGIDVNKALNDYLEKIISEGYKPEHKTKKTPEISMSELRGICKGKLWTSDDFDEPLDDLKEYME